MMTHNQNTTATSSGNISSAQAGVSESLVQPRSSFYDHIRAAADAVVEFALATYADGQGRVYGETAIAAVAALTGEFALRSTGMALPDKGALVVGGVQDGILFADTANHTAWSMITRAAAMAGLKPEELPDLSDIISRTLSGFGKSQFPPLTVPPRHFPRECALNAGPRLRGRIVAIGERYSLPPTDIVLVLGWAVGAMIIMMRKSLPPAISVRLAAEVMIGMSRVGPLDRPMDDLVRSHAAA